MTRKELIRAVAEVTGGSIVATTPIVLAVFEKIVEAMQNDDKISIVGFGTFGAKETPERQGRNPQTGESMTIPKKKRIKFSASQNLKNLVV